jgi:hypothetical protein
VRNTYFVPVRTSKAGTLALRTGRLPSGERVGLAFTSESSLRLTMGPSQQWARLDGEALRDMLEPLGIEHIRVDAHSPRPAPVRIRTAAPCLGAGRAVLRDEHAADPLKAPAPAQLQLRARPADRRDRRLSGAPL